MVAMATLVVLSGPSGVGKSTVVHAVRELVPEIWISVSATTRAPRPGEIDGIHYNFVSEDTFAHLVTTGGLLEWAEFAGHFYGTPREPVLAKLAEGTPVLLEIELQGARQIRASMPEAVLVFLTPPTWADLVERLEGRGTENPEVVERRLARAEVELAAAREFDVTIVNSSVQEAADQLVRLTGLRQ